MGRCGCKRHPPRNSRMLFNMKKMWCTVAYPILCRQYVPVSFILITKVIAASTNDIDIHSHCQKICCSNRAKVLCLFWVIFFSRLFPPCSIFIFSNPTGYFCNSKLFEPIIHSASLNCITSCQREFNRLLHLIAASEHRS